MGNLIGIDQGTSSTTVLIIDHELRVKKRTTRPIVTRSTGSGGVEQDPWQVLGSVVESVSEAMEDLHGGIDAAGLAHQGETVLAWDPNTLRPLTPAIVWSDRRAEAVIGAMAEQGLAEKVRELSGARLDSYFCAAKYRWLLDEWPDLARRAVDDGLRLGTLETWLLLQLGAEHQTDIGTASRTQLTRLGDGAWDPDLVSLFGLSANWLAPIGDSIGEKGALFHEEWSDAIPIRAAMVDQPAALLGHGCVDAGDVKVTYGTGAFAMVNVGRAKPPMLQSLVASVGWGDQAGPIFTLDGGVLSVGSALSWLAGIGADVGPEAHERLRGRPPSSLKVMPAMNGRGAPRWDRTASASISGITADTDGDDLLHGFLDSFAFRVREIIEATGDAGVPRPSSLRVDGGLTRSAYLMQFQADVLDLEVAVSAEDEATALGIAAAAGSHEGKIDLRELVRPSSARYEPVDPLRADDAYHHWLDTVYNDG